MIRATTLCWLFILYSGTAPAKTSLYQSGSQFYKLEFKDGISASPVCFTKDSCEAFRRIRSVKNRTLPKTLGGQNPYSLLCTKTYSGNVVIAADPLKNQDSLCVFEDGSVISCGSIGELMSRPKE